MTSPVGPLQPTPLATPRFRLAPVTPDLVEDLYAIAIDPAVSTRIRWRGSTPSLSEFAASMTDAVLAQFAILDTDEEVRGAVVLSSASYHDQHAHFSAFTDENSRGSDIGFHASLLMLHYGFATWPFRKLYIEVPERNDQPHWKIAPDFMVKEGTLTQHYFYQGSFQDVFIYAFHRDAFFQHANPVINEFATPTSP